MAFYSDKDKALLRAVRQGNTKQVEKILQSNGLVIDHNWMDYTLLLTAFKRHYTDIIELLLKIGCRVKRVPESNVFKIPVHYAVRMRDASILKKLLDKGATVYDRNGSRRTPICLAMEAQQFSMVDTLLSMYDFDNINPFDPGDIDHFLIACERNMLKVIKNFVEHGISVNNFIYYKSFHLRGFTPLHIAVKNMCLETVNFLLSKGADIVARNCEQRTPLHVANQIRENKNSARIEAIIDSLLLSAYTTCANPIDDNGVSHFHIACTRNNVDIVQRFLHCKVDINHRRFEKYQTFDLYSALHYAVYYNCIRVVELLLNRNVNVNAVAKGECLPLHIAILHGNTKIVKLILKRDEVDIIGYNMKFGSLLHYAFNCEHKNFDIIDMLLQRVPKTRNIRDKYLLSYLHIACTRNNPEVVKKILKNKVYINERVTSNAIFFAGYTPLHFAVKYNCKSIVQLLLEHNADTNVQEANKLTPLHLACVQNLTKFYELIYKYKEELAHKWNPVIDWKKNHEDQIEIVKLLLKRNANVNATDDTYCTPLFYAHGFRPKSIKKEIEKRLKITVNNTLEQIILKELNARRKKIVDLLLSHNADVNIPDYRNRTMLYFASEREEETDNLVEMAELFLKHGANINAADTNCITPLHLAVKYRITKLVEVFLSHNANINCVESFNFSTPLHLALTLGKYKLVLKEMIKLLIEKGADVNAKQMDGKTPLHIACLTKNYYAVYKLLQYGADINSEDKDGYNALHFNFAMYGFNNNSSTKVELVHHIKKLKVIGYYISENVISFYLKLDENEINANFKADNNGNNCIFQNENDEFIKKCRSEIEKMKLTKIDSYSSLYNILFKNPNEMVRHIKNDNLQKILIAENFERYFPLYGYLLKLQYKKGLERSFILKPAKESLKFITGLRLPDLCYEYILNYLNTTNMENLINCRFTTSSLKRKLGTIACAEDCKSLTKYQRLTNIHSPDTKQFDIP